MSENLKPVKVGILLLTIAVIANLALTIMIYLHVYKFQGTMTSQPLPDSIRSEVNNIPNDIVKYWNEGNTKEQYALLGDVAKSILSFQEFENQISDLQSFGSMNNPRYVNFRAEGKYHGRNAYDLIYTVSVDEKSCGLTISVLEVDGSFEILGFNISTNYVAPDQSG